MTDNVPAYQIPETVVGEELEGEMVLLNLETGIYFGLNHVGTELWQQLGEHGDLQTAISTLEQRYRKVTRGTIRKDAEALIAELESKGLLIPALKPS